METPYVLGVDLGTGMVKVFLAKAMEQKPVKVIGSSALPTVGFEKGIVTDAPKLAMTVRRAVDNALTAAGVPMQDVFLGIGGLDIRSFNSLGSIALEPGNSIAQQEIDKVKYASVNTLLSEDREALHVLPLGYWIDGNKQSAVPLQGKGNSLEAETHVITVAKQMITELVAALQAAGVSTAGVIANAVAGAQILRSQSLPDDCLLMDIGAGTTDMVLYSQGKVQMTVSLPIGGEYITMDLMQGLQVSRSHAEEIKRYYAKLDQSLVGQNVKLDCNGHGTTDKNFTYDFLHKIVESRVEEIVSLLYEYVQPLLIKYGVERIFLTGGCSMMPSVGNSVERIFGMKSELIQAQGLPEEYVHPSSTACFGILHYAMQRQAPKAAKPVAKQPREGLLQRIKKFF